MVPGIVRSPAYGITTSYLDMHCRTHPKLNRSTPTKLAAISPPAGRTRYRFGKFRNETHVRTAYKVVAHTISIAVTVQAAVVVR